MSEPEILHYRLTNAELLQLVGEYNLKYSELKVYLYFVTLDPFGDRLIEFVPAEVCLALRIKKSAFHGSMARLKTLGLLDIHIPRAKAKVTPISKVLLRNSTVMELDSNLMESDSNVVELDSNLMEAHSTRMDTDSNRMDKRSPKPSRRKGSKTSHTNQTNQTNTNSLSQESIAPTSNPVEREKLSLFEEWKNNTAAIGEPEDFEEFVRTERRKAGALEIMHFPSFMGDKYFPEWLEKWTTKKNRANKTTKQAHYQNWTEAQHREIAKEYVIDPVTWMSGEPWRMRWVEFVANQYPSLFAEILKEFDPPISPAPPAPQKLSSTASPPPSQSPPQPTSRLKGKLPNITSKPEVKQLVCPSSRFRKRQVQDG